MREGGRLFAQRPGIDPRGACPVLGWVQEHEFHPSCAGEPDACGSPLRTSGSQGNAWLATLKRLFPRHPPDANVSSWRAAWGWMLPCPLELSTTAPAAPAPSSSWWEGTGTPQHPSSPSSTASEASSARSGGSGVRDDAQSGFQVCYAGKAAGDLKENIRSLSVKMAPGDWDQ